MVTLQMDGLGLLWVWFSIFLFWILCGCWSSVVGKLQVKPDLMDKTTATLVFLKSSSKEISSPSL